MNAENTEEGPGENLNRIPQPNRITAEDVVLEAAMRLQAVREAASQLLTWTTCRVFSGRVSERYAD
jgi:hypothetical protein